MPCPAMHPKSKLSSVSAPQSASFPWRMLVYSLVLLYLLTDLFWLGGPLRNWVDSRLPESEASRERAMEEGWVALVNGVPVLRGDVDLALTRHLALTGQDWDSLGAQARQMERLRALDQVVRERLLLTYSQLNPIRQPDDEEAIEAELQRWRSLLAAPARTPDIDAESPDFADLIRREWRLARWVESRISPFLEVTDADVQAWLAQNPAALEVPQRHRVRHLYLSRHREAGTERADELQRIGNALAADAQDSGWDQIVAEFSEDPATVESSGQLGWVSRERMPEDFMLAVEQAAASPGEISGPHATALGWHWIVVDETRSPRTASFGEVATEVRAHLETQRRHTAVEDLIARARSRAKIFYYHEVLLTERGE